MCGANESDDVVDTAEVMPQTQDLPAKDAIFVPHRLPKRLGPGGIVEQVEELVVARRLALIVGLALAARIAEVMGLIDDDDIGELGDPGESLREVPHLSLS